MQPSQTLSIDGVAIHLDGDGSEAIVMVHGWPDTHRLWDGQVAYLKERYRCIRFTLPGFDIAQPRRAVSLDQMSDFIRRVIEQLAPGKKAILLLHDWGCLFGYQFYARYPQLVSRIVGVDIGDTKNLKKASPAREKLYIMAYQLWLSLAWRLGARTGDWMVLRMKRLMKSPSDERFMGSCMCYPYYYTWFGGDETYRKQFRRFEPSCPMLFVYAKRKPVKFHTEAWLEQLRSRKENGVVAFDTGHWIMLQQPERFNRTVGDWLSAATVS